MLIMSIGIASPSISRKVDPTRTSSQTAMRSSVTRRRYNNLLHRHKNAPPSQPVTHHSSCPARFYSQRGSQVVLRSRIDSDAKFGQIVSHVNNSLPSNARSSHFATFRCRRQIARSLSLKLMELTHSHRMKLTR